MGFELIETLFPDLTEAQKTQFRALPALYADWNVQINLISRKDMEHFVERHILHSLSLAFYWKPQSGHSAIDIGTGGGFPGIPLAILYPEVDFLLVDSIGKKLKAVEDIATAIGLQNVAVRHIRAEEIRGKFDVAISRAVARLDTLARYCAESKLKVKELYCLKGGDLREEVEEIDRFPSRVHHLNAKLKDEFFDTKKVVYLSFA